MTTTVTSTGITFNDATTQTTAAVVSSTAGNVGSYMWARPTAGSIYNFGDTLAGSSLKPTAAFYSFEKPGNANSTGTFSAPLGSARSGTWRCMGQTTSSNGDMDTEPAGSSVSYLYNATLWLRIS